ncbi:hypothetical protein E2C01_090664 [Portunus trituberculatus]|uniref:Reverse transcriptase zinc-binding domain-containing protein n=1 Tax=Portunus trituberculatus TaxID=210409 RepID=A0A5B7JH81_PORTR|nr:hypothetical protein [Portunus trituberculatus]
MLVINSERIAGSKGVRDGGVHQRGGSREGAQGKSAIARFRLSHTTLSAHLHRLRLSPDPFCPWCKTTLEAMKHFLLQCPRLHSQHTALLCSRLSVLAITTRPAHPPSWWPQASTAPGNLLSFALHVPSCCDTHTG